ncbi:MAG: selenocysteine-specific translation elongation factor [Syntrophobacteraceae bacterium]|nr:selenocysteine-specific translation elongation factor [Syntrophobacteraceae bacterium]
MKQVILGTAGHIDHGKTSLIRALTGIDTDRLKEEKLRGITIELGFAHMDLPGGERLGIVDVPGHEKFVKHMVAGATGIDLVALVIAADEGVMPQTREHMEICELLRVKKGIVVLTKTDLVEDPDWMEMVREDIAQFIKGTFLEGSEILAVSAATSEGIEELKKSLARLFTAVEPKSADGPFRLPVDRVFTMRGFGTVITGTSISGRLRVGDPVVVYPEGLKSKVRGIQVHGNDVEEVLPGQRTAVNLQGMERALIERGNVLASAGALHPSPMVDVQLQLLRSAPRPLKHRAKIRFHTGTAEHLATVVLLDREELKPGDKTFAQVRLDQPTAVLRGDRFVLRSYSPVQTIGGGSVLNPIPRKHKGAAKREAASALENLFNASDPDIILWHLHDAGWAGLDETELRIRANLPMKFVDKTLQQFMSTGKVVIYDKDNRRLIDPGALEEMKAAVTSILSDYHGRFPLKAGMPKEEIPALLAKSVDARLYNFVLRHLAEEGKIGLEMEWVRLATHKVALSKDEETIREKIEKTFRDAGLQPPFFREVETALSGTPKQRQEVLQWMLAKGTLVKTKEEIYFHAAAMAQLQDRLVAWLKEHGEITTPQFKEMTGASRKYTIPLIEYFDAQKVTIRIGDVRKLRGG